MRPSRHTVSAIVGAILGAAGALAIGGAAVAVETGFNSTLNKTGGGEVGAGLLAYTPENVASYIIEPLIGLVGVVFLVLMVVAGFMWMTAAGNEERISKAKKLIVGAIIGMVLVFSAYYVTELVFTSVGSGITQDDLDEESFNECLNSDAPIPDCAEDEAFDFTSCACEPFDSE